MLWVIYDAYFNFFPLHMRCWPVSVHSSSLVLLLHELVVSSQIALVIVQRIFLSYLSILRSRMLVSVQVLQPYIRTDFIIALHSLSLRFLEIFWITIPLKERMKLCLSLLFIFNDLLFIEVIVEPKYFNLSTLGNNFSFFRSNKRDNLISENLQLSFRYFLCPNGTFRVIYKCVRQYPGNSLSDVIFQREFLFMNTYTALKSTNKTSTSFLLKLLPI